MAIRVEENNKSQSILLFEATSSGVKLKPWRVCRDGIGGFYDRAVFRRLSLYREESALGLLDQFVKDSHGSKYNF
jgi:hypothetical protein